MAISTENLNIYRNSAMQTLDPTLVAVPTEIVATADVLTAPTSYPAASVSVTNTSANWADIVAGYFFKIVSPANVLVMWGVTRLDASESVLYIDAKSQGDPGLANNIHTVIQANDNITVYRIRPLWTMLSRISNGVFFKKFDVAYDGSGSNPNPVVNMGRHQIIKVNNTGEEGLVSLDASSSFDLGSRNLNTHLWSIPNTATVISGTINNPALTISVPQGFYEVTCTITNSGGASTTGVRGLWIVGPDAPPLSEQYGLEITGDDTDRLGRELSFKVKGDNIGDDILLPGTMVAFSDFPKFDNNFISDTHIVDYFVGFITNRTIIFEEGVSGEQSVSFTAYAPYKMLSQIPQVSQVIVETNAPSAWEEIAISFGHVNFAVWYVLKHHTTFMELFDYSPLPDAVPPRKKSWGLNGNTIAAQLEEIASSTLGNIGSASDGTLYLRRHPSLEDNTYRTALENVINWGTADLRANPEIPHKFFNQTAYVRLYILSMQTDNETEAFASIAPGTQQGQSTGSTQYESVLLVPNSSQTECNELSGHIYSKENAPFSDMSLSVVRNFDVADPALMLWHTLSISAADSPLNQDLLYRMIPLSVSRSWSQTDSGTWIKEIDLVSEIETFGQPGVKLPINIGDALNFPAFPEFEIPFGSLPPSTPTGEDDGSSDNDEGLDTSAYLNGFATLISSDNKLFASTSFNNKSPGWVEITGLAEYANWATWDYGSAFFTTGDITKAVGLLTVSTGWDVEAFMQIHRVPNIRDEGPADLLATLDISGDVTFLTNGRIAQDEEDPNLILVTWKAHDGTYFVRSTDNGLSWTSIAAVDFVGDDADENDNAQHGISIYQGRQATTAYDATLDYSVYYADGAGAWNRVDPTAIQPATVAPMSVIEFTNNKESLYVANALFQAPPAFTHLIDTQTHDPSTYTWTWEPLPGAGTDPDGPPVIEITQAEADFTTPEEGYSIDYRMTPNPPVPMPVNVAIGFTTLGTSFDLDTSGGFNHPDFRIVMHCEAYDADDNLMYTFNPLSGSFMWEEIGEIIGGNSVTLPPSTEEYVSYFIVRHRWTRTGDGWEYNHIRQFGSNQRWYSWQKADASGQGKFWRLSNVSGAASWNTISLPNTETFINTGDFSMSNASAQIAGVTDYDGNLYLSDNAGVAWTLREGLSTKAKVIRKGELLLTAGLDELWVSVNKGVDFYNKKGNILNVAGGSIGEVVQLLTV